MDLAPLITAIGTFLTGIIGALILLIRELRRIPRANSRVHRMTSLLRRIRDWLEAEGIWEQLPPSLQRDIGRTLDAADALEEEENSER